MNEELRWLQQLGKDKDANSDRPLEAVPLAIDASDLEKPSDDSKDDFAVKVWENSPSPEHKLVLKPGMVTLLCSKKR